MTSLRSRTRVCRHTVVCGRLTGGMGPGASPGAGYFLPPLLSWVGWGFVAERRPVRLRFAFPLCVVRVSWVARLVGWLAFRAVAPHFSCVARYLALLLPVVACAPGSLCGVLGDVESLACVLGRFRRESPRGARTARFSWVFGRYGGRVVLRGFCDGAILLLSWLCLWLVARLQGRACFLK